MDKTKFYIDLGIYNFNCSPEVVTKTLGIQPDKAYTTGDIEIISPNAKHPLKREVIENRWHIYKMFYDQEEMERVIAKSAHDISERFEDLKAVATGFKVRLAVIIYAYDVNPGFLTERSVIKDLANIDAEMDVDIYSLASVANKEDEDEGWETVQVAE